MNANLAGMDKMMLTCTLELLRCHSGRSSGQEVDTFSAGMEENDTHLYACTLRCHPGQSSGQTVGTSGAGMEGKHGAN